MGTLAILEAHNFLCTPLIEVRFKESCSFHWELSNGLWHATCTQVNWGYSQFLVVKNQIDNLTLGFSFSHNLCFKYANGLCKPILDIYIPSSFQWYKEFFNPMSFGPCNHPLKIRESNSQSGNSLGSVGLHSFIFSYISRSLKCNSWVSFLARTFASPCLGCEPKVTVVTKPLPIVSMFPKRRFQNCCTFMTIRFTLRICAFLKHSQPFQPLS